MGQSRPALIASICALALPSGIKRVKLATLLYRSQLCSQVTPGGNIQATAHRNIALPGQRLRGIQIARGATTIEARRNTPLNHAN